VTCVSRIDVLTAQLPFRFAFRHALADRQNSTNVYVKVTLDSGVTGFGEGVPREYVTGETPDTAVAALCDRFVPALLGHAFTNPQQVVAILDAVCSRAESEPDKPFPAAAWCALELALLDACGKHFGRPVWHWLGSRPARLVHYSAVIPFTKSRQLAALAILIRLVGIRQVKIKVGEDLAVDLRALRLLRRLLGAGADLRVDANCAWDVAQALESIACMRPFSISAVEQPVPADDLDGLRRVTAATPELIIADESVRTVAEARILAQTRACNAFNIRVSKCGGLLNSVRIARIAAQAGLPCIVGAQVGESGILSAAGRALAASIPSPRYVEGSAGRLLLKQDLTVENVIPAWRGRASVYRGSGLGVRVKEEALRRYSLHCHSYEAGPAPRGDSHL
jgi:L-Ala-D/L-Glu epimerase